MARVLYYGYNNVSSSLTHVSLMVKHMTFNHYYMSSNPIALKKEQPSKVKR